MKNIKIGVIGCADVAERCMIPAIKAAQGIELIAVASRTKEKAEHFANKYSCEAAADYEQLVDRDDIDAVYIPLPIALHEEWIMKALKRGKHVLAEKSLSVDFLSVQRIIKEAENRQLLVMEDFMFQYHSQHAFVQKLIVDGEIGDIRFFRSSFGFPPRDKDDIRYDKQLGGGALLDAGGYVVKAAQMFLGSSLTVGGAFLRFDQELDIDVCGGALLKNYSGQIAHLSFSFDNYYQCNYEIWGSRGKIMSDRVFTAPPNFSPRVVLEKQDNRQEFVLKPDNHFISILQEFRRAVEEKDCQRHWDESLLQAKLLNQIREKHEQSS